MSETMNIDAMLLEIERQRFLNDHIHLILPAFFAPAERSRRDAALLRWNWDRAAR